MYLFRFFSPVLNFTSVFLGTLFSTLCSQTNQGFRYKTERRLVTDGAFVLIAATPVVCSQVVHLQGKWLCSVWINAPPNLLSNLQKIKIRATEPNLCFLSPLIAPQEWSCQRQTERWEGKEERGRRGKQQNCEEDRQEEGKSKIDVEPHCDCCLRMFVKSQRNDQSSSKDAVEEMSRR